MKHSKTKALLCLISLLSIFNSYGQNNYIQAGSLAGIEIRQGGGAGSICPVSKSEFSSSNITNQFFFTAIECNASFLKFEIFNPTPGTVKITIRTQNGASIVDSRTLASGASSGEMLLPTYAANYLWSFETSFLPITLVNDIASVDAGIGAIIQPKKNDIAIPANTGYRVKTGQTVTVGSLVQNSAIASELFLSNTSVGSQTVTIEAYNTATNAVLGESTLTINVNAACSLNLTNIIQAGLQTYNVTLSSNRTTRPYYYSVINALGVVLKNGNTSSLNITNTELIDVGNIPTGTYNMKIISTLNGNCGEVNRTFNHVNSVDICTMNATAVRSLNNYLITLPNIAGVSGYDFVLKTPTDSVITQGVITGTSRVFDFTGRYDGIYTIFLKPQNSTKICSQIINLVWQNINSTTLRGYVKKYNNVPDFYEIAGSGNYGGVKDGGTGWVTKENKTVLVWQTYVKSLTNSTTKAILTLREDSSSSSRHISVAVLNDKIQIIQRTTKNAQNLILLEAPSLNAPLWVRIQRSGNVATIRYSTSDPESANPVFITASTLPNAFLGWKATFYKGLYTTSANLNTLASAEFHRFLGGAYTGTTAIADNTPNNPPVIEFSSANPTVNASVVLTSSACKSGYLIQFYKNGLPIFQGNNYNVTVTYGDNYKAKCEKGNDKSAFSNTITFTAPSSTQICGISDNTLLGQKTASATIYTMFARIFNGKLWLTQSLNTTPESFLVRGINLLTDNFVKVWSGNDYSCFEGQNTGFGGNVEPAGFVTPAGYTQIIQADGAKIYRLGTIAPTPDGTGTGTGTGQSSFVNILKTVPLETQTDRYSVLPFTVSGGTKLKNYDGTRQVAKYPVVWHSKLDNFIRAGRKTWEIGISSPVDIIPFLGNVADLNGIVGNQAGDGVRCVDYILYVNPNTGQAWANNIDPVCNQSVFNFISARPFQYRVKAEGGTILSMEGWTNERLFDEGYSYTTSDQFGYGDNVGNKHNTGFTVSDVENGEHGRIEEIPIKIGMASGSMGNIVGMYNQAINVVNPELSHYPLNYATGGYVPNRIELDGTIALDGNGNLQQNNVINESWKPENKVTIPSRGISNKGFIDFPTIKECGEVSCLASAAFHQGELINYDNDDKTLTRTINKFGLNRNTEHIVAHTIYATEVRKWHLRKNFNDRNFYTLSKTLCDRLNIGLTNYGKFGNAWVTNTDLQAYHLPRDLAFMKSMVTAFNGSYLYMWDRNTFNKQVDGYSGDLFAINLLNQRKSLPQGNLSFVDLFDNFDFKLWTSEISYDNGATWKQEKGVDYIMSATSTINRQVITSDGVWGVFLARPENTENLTCKLRITYNGVLKYFDITPLMWETTDPAYANTALANIPNVAKDYYYNLIDVSGGVQQNGTSSAPSIFSSPANPTAGTSVTFTSAGCSGTTKWFVSDAQVGLGASLTVANPVAGNSYFANCTVLGVASTPSNYILIASNTPAPPTLSSCNNNGNFSLLSSSYANSQVTFQFNAANLGSGTYSILNGLTVVDSGVFSPTSSTVVVNSGVLPNATYTLRITGVSCSGTTQQTLVMLNNSLAPPPVSKPPTTSGSVVTTEPNKPPYFYSNGQTPGFYANRANLPAVITNTATFEEADVVKLKNADIEVWFNLKRGGQICYASKPNTPINRVYNGYDGGFQWVFDGSQYLVGGNLNGQVSISPQNNVNYNTTMGGDAENNSQTLIDYRAIPNGYYFKFRPILYNFRATVSEIELEVTYTLVGKSIKVEYKYMSFRTDGNIERNNPFRLMGFHVPICFLTNNFTKYAIYTGSQPWTNATMSEGNIPNITGGAAPSFGANSTEFMGISYDPVSNFAVGVLNNSDGGSMANLTWEQLNKWSGGSAGTVFSGPYTTMAISSSPAIPDGSNYQKTWTSYLTLGDSKEAVRAELRTRAGQ